MTCRSEVCVLVLELVNRIRRSRGMECIICPDVLADLRGDLQLDSLDLAELTVRIQDKFGVDVFAVGVVRTWGELLQRVEAYVARTGRS